MNNIFFHKITYFILQILKVCNSKFLCGERTEKVVPYTSQDHKINKYKYK